MYNPPKSEYSEWQSSTSDELKIVRALSSIDTLLDDVLDIDQANVSNIERLLQILDEGENEYAVSIDRIRHDLLYEKELKTAQVFNPIKVDLEMPFHRNNAVTAVFWTTAVFVLLLSCGLCYKCCPCIFPNTWKACKLSMEGWCSMCKNCTRIRNNNEEVSLENQERELEEISIRPVSPQEENSPFLGASEASAPSETAKRPSRPLPETPGPKYNLSTPHILKFAKRTYPSLVEEIYNSENPTHEWIISKGEYGELSIISYIPVNQGGSVRVIFDTIENEVMDEHGRLLKYVKKPPDNLIEEFKHRVSISSPPNSFTDQDGTIRLLSNFAIVFSPLTNNWVDSSKKKIIPGLNKPDMST
jgi:hypothetical protein